MYCLCCSMYFCVVLCIVCFVTFPVLFVCICVLNNCHRVATQLQLNISYRIIYIHTYVIVERKYYSWYSHSGFSKMPPVAFQFDINNVVLLQIILTNVTPQNIYWCCQILAPSSA